MGNSYSLRLFTKPVGSQCQADFDSVKHLEIEASELNLGHSTLIRSSATSEWKNATLRYLGEPTTTPRVPVHLRIFTEPTDGQLFWTQLHFMRRLRHPNVATVKGYVYTTEHVILMTDSSPKGTLRQLLDSTQASGLPLQTVLSLAKDVANALIYLNSQGIRYPILTSNNIVAQDTDIYGNSIPLSAVLTDLGDFHPNWQDGDVPKPANPTGGVVRAESTVLTRATRGTPLGMDVPTLLYNFGILLWEMFTGLKPRSYLPPTHDSSSKTWPNIDDITNASPEYFLPEKVPDDCPRELANIMYLCWSKRPFLRLGLAEIVEVLEFAETTYLGNAASLLHAERLNKTKVSFLTRIDQLLNYIDRVSSFYINVSDLVGALEDLSGALERSRKLDLCLDFSAIDVVLETLESIFPSRIVDKHGKRLNKYWAEYASTKKGKLKLERAVGQLVILTSEFVMKSAVNIANAVLPSGRRSAVSGNVGSSKLVHQILFENLSPGHTLRIRTPTEVTLVEEFDAAALNAKQTAVTQPLAVTQPPATGVAPGGSATNLLGSFGMVGGALGANSRASMSKELVRKGQKGSNPPAPTPAATSSNLDILALASQSSSAISTSVATTRTPIASSSSSSSLNAPRQVAINPSTMNTDDYLAALVTGVIGKSVVKEVDTKRVASSTLEKQQVTIMQIQGKQYYGEEIGFGPVRRQVLGSAASSSGTISKGSAPSSTQLSSSNLTTTSSQTLSRTPSTTSPAAITTTAAPSGPPKVAPAATGGWKRTTAPSVGTAPNATPAQTLPATTPAPVTTAPANAENPENTASVLKEKKPERRSLFRLFKKSKKYDSSEIPRASNDPGAPTTRNSVLIDSTPQMILEPQREAWLSDSRQWNRETVEGGFMPSREPAPGSASSDEGGFMPMTRNPEPLEYSSSDDEFEMFDVVPSSLMSFVNASPFDITPLQAALMQEQQLASSQPSAPTQLPPASPASPEVPSTNSGAPLVAPNPAVANLINSSTGPSLARSTEVFNTVEFTSSPLSNTGPTAHTLVPPVTPNESAPVASTTPPGTQPQESSEGSLRIRVTSTRRISLVERLNWDANAKEFWRTNFGIGVNTVPWTRFSAALSEHMAVLPEDMDTLRLILDNNSAGYVSASTFSEFLNSHGPLATAVQRTREYRSQPWFVWYLSHDDCITLIKHCQPGTFVVRFSQSSPSQFALTVKQSHGSFVKCLIYAERGRYKAKPDDPAVYDEIIPLVKASAGNLLPYTESWHHAPWFKGALSSEDSIDLLSNMAAGEYFVRLSTKGAHFVLALVTGPGAVVQEAFTRDGPQFVVFTAQGEIRVSCNSVEEFIQQRKEAQQQNAPPYLAGYAAPGSARPLR